MNQTADENNFIVVYPDGSGSIIEGYGGVFVWNGGPHVPSGTTPFISELNDIGFVETLLDTLQSRHKIDSKKIFAAGMSMGGMMVFRVASELSHRFAAIASISGPMGTEHCSPKLPVSVLYFHGTEDPAVPFNGGKGKIDPSGNVYFSANYSVDKWVEANGCNKSAVVKNLPNKANDSTTVIKRQFSHGRNNSEVIFYQITGGGHTWPGRDFGPGSEAFGKSTKDIYANDLIWTFFEQHARH